MPSQFETDWSLYLAARTGDCAVATQALAAGADPNFCPPPNTKRPLNEPGSTLLRAVRNGHTDFVKLLLDAGASLPTSTYDRKLLAYAAQCAKSPEMLLLLLERGLPPTPADLEWATAKGHRAVREFAERSLGPFKISYDIDHLLSLGFYDFMIQFSKAMPSEHSPYDAMLYPEEKVLRAVWEFMCATGSGLYNLSTNQEALDRICAAFVCLKDCSARYAVLELRALVEQHAASRALARSKWIETGLEEEGPDAMDIGLEELDSKYFGSNADLNLWENVDHLKNAYEYAKEHHSLLTTRNAGAS